VTDTATIVDQGNINVGGTLTVLGNSFTNSGTITVGSSGGALSGVTYDGTLDLSGAGDSVSLTSGTVVQIIPPVSAKICPLHLFVIE
jgi:hypothetical protein